MQPGRFSGGLHLLNQNMQIAKILSTNRHEQKTIIIIIYKFIQCSSHFKSFRDLLILF